MNIIKSINLSEEFLAVIDLGEPDIQKLKYLLNEGADINYGAEQDGYTPLMLAVDNDNESLVTFLLEQGANPLIKNHYDEIPSDIALNYSPIYQLLKGYELLFASHINDIDAVKSAISAGVDVDFQGLGGHTAKMIAVEQNHLQLIEFFEGLSDRFSKILLET